MRLVITLDLSSANKFYCDYYATYVNSFLEPSGTLRKTSIVSKAYSKLLVLFSPCLTHYGHYIVG